uniref:ORF3 n=3 Tax=Torque teno virus TaxID=68887 RepID=Q91D05_9VIRU|nr:ORF3 [Torque teno virus]
MSFVEPLLSSTHREIAFYHGCVQMHKAFCGCDNFLTHLQRITTYISANQHTPPSTPSNTLRRARALPAAPEPAPWRGPGGGRGGAEGGRGEGEGGEDYAPEDLDDLFAAVARDTELSETLVKQKDTISLTPVDSIATYKLLTHTPWAPNGRSTPGTGDVDSLVQRLSKECLNNKYMMNCITQLQRNLDSSLQYQASKSKKETTVRRRKKTSPPQKKRRTRRKKSKNSSSDSTSSSKSSSDSETNSDSSSESYRKPKRVST